MTLSYAENESKTNTSSNNTNEDADFPELNTQHNVDPEISHSVIQGVTPPAPEKNIAQEDAPPVRDEFKHGKFEILSLIPGEHKALKISGSAPNLIRMWFDDPKVVSLDPNINLKVRGRNIYFTTPNVSGFYIETPNGDISYPITVIPAKIPSRTYFIHTPGMENREVARNWEKSNPYITTLKEIAKAMALSETIDGYKMIKLEESSQSTGYVVKTGIFVNVNVEYIGAAIKGQIATVTNLLKTEVSLTENEFYADKILGVMFERISTPVVLQPQETMTVYIIKQI